MLLQHKLVPFEGCWKVRRKRSSVYGFEAHPIEFKCCWISASQCIYLYIYIYVYIYVCVCIYVNIHNYSCHGYQPLHPISHWWKHFQARNPAFPEAVHGFGAGPTGPPTWKWVKNVANITYFLLSYACEGLTRNPPSPKIHHFYGW